MLTAARACRARGQSVTQIARELGVGRSTLDWTLEDDDPPSAAAGTTTAAPSSPPQRHAVRARPQFVPISCVMAVSERPLQSTHESIASR